MHILAKEESEKADASGLLDGNSIWARFAFNSGCFGWEISVISRSLERFSDLCYAAGLPADASSVGATQTSSSSVATSS